MVLFGEILTINSEYGTIVFITVLFFILLFEGALGAIESSCENLGLQILVKKLYREFMIMGFISFALYIISDQYSFSDHTWFDAFHFAHILLLFIGITFLIQSALLVSLIYSRNMTLLRHDNNTSEDLLVKYIDLQKMHEIWKFLFNYGPISIPIPELREKIEFKIIQEFFIRTYCLPEEFKFANYMCLVLKEYVIGLVEVRPISWLFLSSCVALNYGRIAVVDPKYQYSVCKPYLERQTGEYTDSASCPEYLLRYVLICSAFIAVFFFLVFVASEIYIRRLIDKMLDVEEVLQLIEADENLEKRGHAQQSKEGTASTSLGDTDLENSHSAEVVNHVPDVNHNHRRHLYFKCLERIMELEFELHQNRARHDNSRPFDKNRQESKKPVGHNSSRFSFSKALSRQFSFSPSPSPSPITSDRFHSSLVSTTVEDEDITRNSVRSQSKERIRSTNIKEYRDSLIRMQTRRVEVEDGEDDMDTNSSFNDENYQGGNGKLVSRSRNNSHQSTDSSHRDTMAELFRNKNCKQRVEDIKVVLQKQVAERQKQLLATNSLDPDSSQREVDPASRSRSDLNEDEEASMNVSVHSYQNCESDDPESQSKEEESSANITGSHARHQVTFDVKPQLLGLTHNFRNSLQWSKRVLNSRAIDKKDTALKTDHVAAADSPTGDEELSTDDKQRRSNRMKRAYSVEFFDMHQSLEHYQEQSRKKKESQTSCSSACFRKMTTRGENIMSVSQTLWIAGRWLLMKVLEILLSSKETSSQEGLEDIRSKQDSLTKIFLFRSPTLYYLIVELALLVQCVYIALWATNFVVIAQISDHPILWQILLLLPLPTNFFILKRIIFTSSMLKAIVTIDKGIADKICEEAIDVRNVTQRLRKAVRKNLIAQHPHAHECSKFVKKKFNVFCDRSDVRRVNKKRFQDFLHSMKLFFTDESVSKIFSVIDFDNDGWVAWADLYPILFPELQKKKLTIMSRKSTSVEGRLSFEYRRERDHDDDPDGDGVHMSTFVNPSMKPKFYLSKIFGSVEEPQKESSSDKLFNLDDDDDDESESAPAAEGPYVSSDEDSDAENDGNDNSSKSSAHSRTGTDSFRLLLPSNRPFPQDTTSANNAAPLLESRPPSNRRVSFNLDEGGSNQEGSADEMVASSSHPLDFMLHESADHGRDYPARESVVLVDETSSVAQDNLFYDV